MFRKLSITLLALASCSAAIAHEHTHTAEAGAAYAIENPLRPGAKAPYCEAQVETADGCTFHSVAGATYDAHLTVGTGETWVATPSDANTIKLETNQPADAHKGQGYQVIKVVPSPAKNADLTVLFDRIAAKAGVRQVVERRRITVMIHPS